MSDPDLRLVPTLADAIAKRVVVCPNGQTGVLVSVPRASGVGPKDPALVPGKSRGAKARVRLPSGAFLSVPVSDLTLVPLEDS